MIDLGVGKGPGKRNTEMVYSLEVVNNTEAPVAFEVRLMDYGRVYRVTRSAVKPVARDGGRVLPLTLAPGERRTVGYSLLITP